MEQSRYVNDLLRDNSDDDFAQHLVELHRSRHIRILKDELTGLGSGSRCIYCLPEWYGWVCGQCAMYNLFDSWVLSLNQVADA